MSLYLSFWIYNVGSKQIVVVILKKLMGGKAVWKFGPWLLPDYALGLETKLSCIMLCTLCTYCGVLSKNNNNAPIRFFQDVIMWATRSSNKFQFPGRHDLGVLRTLGFPLTEKKNPVQNPV